MKGEVLSLKFCGLKRGLMLLPNVRQISRESRLHTSDTAIKISLNEKKDQAVEDVSFSLSEVE